MISPWWAVLAFFVGGFLGMLVVSVLAVGHVTAAKRVYWRRRVKVLRKRRQERDVRRANQIAEDVMWQRIQAERLKDAALNPPAYRSIEAIAVEKFLSTIGFHREIP